MVLSRVNTRTIGHYIVIRLLY